MHWGIYVGKDCQKQKAERDSHMGGLFFKVCQLESVPNIVCLLIINQVLNNIVVSYNFQIF